MKTVWTDGLDDKLKLEVKGDFLSSHLVRKRLVKILEDKIDSKRTFMRNADRYQSPNWPHLVADEIGYERALYEVISLISE